MIEVEVKVKISEADNVENILQDCGFNITGVIKEKDTYYTSDKYDVKERGEALRIRVSENRNTYEKISTINFKGKKLDNVSMARQELETTVGDPELCRQILESIGFYEAGYVSKVRRYYTDGNITACYDSVEGLGDFMEFEIISESEDQREKCLNDIDVVLKKIGKSMKDSITTSYLSMLQNLES